VLKHPACSSDLVSCNFHTSGLLKEALVGAPTWQLSNSPLHITATLFLSLSCPSIAAHPVSTHCSQIKRTFPSRNLSQHIYAISHAYQTCQLANGRAGEQREIHIKRLRFQPEIDSTSASSRRHIHTKHSSRQQESQQQSQERLTSIKKGSQSPTQQDGQPVPY